MPNNLELMINRFIPQEYRKNVRDAISAGNQAASSLVNTFVTTPIGTIVNQGRQIYDSLTRELPANSISAANEYDMMIAELRNNLSNLTRSDEIGERARQDLIMNIIALAPGMSTQTAKNIVTQASKLTNPRQVSNFVMNKVLGARDQAVRQSANASRVIEQTSNNLKNEITQRFNNSLSLNLPDTVRPGDVFNAAWDIMNSRAAGNVANKSLNQMSQKEAQSLLTTLKSNADEIGKISQRLGVTNANELPNVLNFIKQFGNIIQNSPLWIKATAAGAGLGSVLGMTGLDLFDIYQAYKENGNSLTPTEKATQSAFNNMIKKNPILSMLYSNLEYMTGDDLSLAGLKKLGIRLTQGPVEEREIKQGIRREGLSAQMPEYFQGQSGKRYHVVNDKIYDFSTGKPVNVESALADGAAYYNFQQQQLQDRLNNNQQQQSELRNAARQGYNVTDEMVQPLVAEENAIYQEMNRLNQNPFPDSKPYDETGDLVEQYRARVIQPQQDQALLAQQQQFEDSNKLYQELFRKIAQDTYNDISNYYTPENLAMDYFEYMRHSASGRSLAVSPEQFAQMQKSKAMFQAAPAIREKSLSYLNNLQSNMINQYKALSEERGRQETARHNMMNEYIDALQQGETARANRVKEQIDAYEAQTGRSNAQTNLINAQTRIGELGVSKQRANIAQQEANIAQQNAETSKQRVQNEAAMLPFKQGQAAAETIYWGSQGTIPLDQFINTNQSVFSQVFPAAFQQQQTNTPESNIQTINQNTRNNR